MVSYFAKYVAKNIDGELVGENVNGRPATESAKRVEAWAAASARGGRVVVASHSALRRGLAEL